MVIRGLFFDLDGTLVDTIEADFKAYQKACAQTGGWKLSAQMHRAVHGMRSDIFLKKLFPDITDKEVKIIRQVKAELYPSFLHLARPNHQLIEFIKTLRDKHTTALVTTASKANSRAVLKASHLENMFDFVVAGDDVEHPKPHPEAYLLALKQTNLCSDEVLAFEDSNTGLEAAEAAGIHSLLISIPREK